MCVGQALEMKGTPLSPVAGKIDPSVADFCQLIYFVAQQAPAY